jgi:hypothetical protein
MNIQPISAQDLQREQDRHDWPSGRSTTGDINADLNTLRSDFNALKDTVTDYVSKTGSDA